MVEYELILIAAVGGIVRNFVGFLKAKLKHGEHFNPGKFIAALTWGGIVGFLLTYLEHGYALEFAPFEVVLLAVGGTVLIDELLQAAFIHKKSSSSSSAPAPKPTEK